MVYSYVARIEAKAHRYSFARYRSQTKSRDRSKRVMMQGVLFTSALFLVYIFPFICGLVDLFIQRNVYALIIPNYILWPLQGFFNALIYSIPTFRTINKRRREGRTKEIYENESPVTPSKSNRMSFLFRSTNKRDYTETRRDNLRHGERRSGHFEKIKSNLFLQFIDKIRNESPEIEKESFQVTHNDKSLSALELGKTIKRKLNFNGEEEKREEIHGTYDYSVLSSSEIMKHGLKKKVECNAIDYDGHNSDDDDDDDDDDMEEMKQKNHKTNEFASPHLIGTVSDQPEENIQSISVDENDSVYDDDIDDYLCLSMR
jgi:hypothetical protein